MDLWDYWYRLCQERTREQKSISRGSDFEQAAKSVTVVQPKTFLPRDISKMRGVRVTHSSSPPSRWWSLFTGRVLTLPAASWWSQQVRLQEDCPDPTTAESQDTLPSVLRLKKLQGNQSVRRWCNCKQGAFSDLLAKIFHSISFNWWIDLTQGKSFTLPSTWHHKFFKLYILIALSFSQKHLLFVSLGFKELVG